MKITNKAIIPNDVKIGDVFKWGTNYYMVVVGVVDYSTYYMIVDISNYTVLDNDKIWNTVEELVKYYSKQGAVFYDRESISMIINE